MSIFVTFDGLVKLVSDKRTKSSLSLPEFLISWQFYEVMITLDEIISAMLVEYLPKVC